jgi:hypothetical protein
MGVRYLSQIRHAETSFGRVVDRRLAYHDQTVISRVKVQAEETHTSEVLIEVPKCYKKMALCLSDLSISNCKLQSAPF